ncbi:cardiolipin synthase [soil metagenome]
MSWTEAIGALFVVSAVVMAVAIVQQRRSPAATIAWLLVLVMVPVGGWLIYRFIGPLRLERKKHLRRASREIMEEAVGGLTAIEAASPAHREQLAKIAIAAGEAPPLRGVAVELFTEGEATYTAIAAAIEAAKHHVHLEYYIWAKDRLGTRLRDQLVKRAQQGIEVRVLVDGTGSSSNAGGAFWKPLVAAGGKVAVFNPVSVVSWRRKRMDFRLHRKTVVCDGLVGFSGGINITEAETREFAGATAWRDTHARLEGPAVLVLQRIFAEDWLYAAGEELAFELGSPYFPVRPGPGAEIVQVVASGPDLDTFAIHKMYFAAINQAATRVWLTTPYFVPDEPMLSALVCAAMRGVDVRVIAPAKGDSRLVELAARSYFPELLDAGAHVYEYKPRFVHAKTFVIDDDIAIVATANMDNRSFRLDFEVATVIYGKRIAAQLETIFREDLEHCIELEPRVLTFWARLVQSAARLLSPLL